MNREALVIEQGLPDELRDQAVEIFEEAFGDKSRTIVRDAPKRKAFLRRAYSAHNCVVARRGDTLLGLAGLSTSGEPFAGGLMESSWDFRPFRDILGLPGAMWAVWGTRMAAHHPRADELYVDGIAVLQSARGLGIGTRLLKEIEIIARANDKTYVRLDVIDRNPRAQALYERLGFRVTKVQSYRYQERLVGFGAMISMEQRVSSATGETGVAEDAR